MAKKITIDQESGAESATIPPVEESYPESNNGVFEPTVLPTPETVQDTPEKIKADAAAFDAELSLLLKKYNFELSAEPRFEMHPEGYYIAVAYPKVARVRNDQSNSQKTE